MTRHHLTLYPSFVPVEDEIDETWRCLFSFHGTLNTYSPPFSTRPCTTIMTYWFPWEKHESSCSTKRSFIIMAPPRRINVSAQLPLVVDSENLDLSTENWPWIHYLTLPVETLNTLHLSRRPYRWILFAIGVVVGAQGVLSAGPNSNLDLDFVGPLTESADLYYNHKWRMFPVDPDIGRTHDTSSVYVARGVPSHDRVTERDIKRCVVGSMMEWHCDAVHLLPHTKGDEACHFSSYFPSCLQY